MVLVSSLQDCRSFSSPSHISSAITPRGRENHQSGSFKVESRERTSKPKITIVIHKASLNSACPPVSKLFPRGSWNSSSSSTTSSSILQKFIVPIAASVVILLLPNPPAAEAGFLSGINGIESVPGPELPSIEFLKQFNEENQKKYAENDARIKSSPIMKELLERSKRNKEKNKQDTFDKYCLRGAEWGVGDCSTAGMTADERDSFIAMLKQKADQTSK